MNKLYDYHFQPIRFDHHADRRIVADESEWAEVLRVQQYTTVHQRAWNELPKMAADVGMPKDRPRILLGDIFEPWNEPLVDSAGKLAWWHERRTDDPKRFDTGMLTMTDVIRRTLELVDDCPHLDFLLPTAWPERVRECWPTEDDGHGGGLAAALFSTTVKCPECGRIFDGDDVDFDSNCWCGSPLADAVDVPAKSRLVRRRDNLYIGAICETQQQADKRLPELLKCRDLSPCLMAWCWPMREALDLHIQGCLCHKTVGNEAASIDWVIAGGDEPLNVDWLRSLRDQCSAAGVPLWVEQTGNPILGLHQSGPFTFKDPNGADPAEWPDDLRVREVPDG